MNDVHKMRCAVQLAGKIGVGICDLQFDDGIPYAVLEWQQTHDGEIPSKRITLNPLFLKPLQNDPEATYFYEAPIREE